MTIGNTILLLFQTTQICIVVENANPNKGVKTKRQFSPIIRLKKHREKFQLFNLQHQWGLRGEKLQTKTQKAERIKTNKEGQRK